MAEPNLAGRSHAEALWQRIINAFVRDGMLPPGNPTPAQIAHQADRLRGDSHASRFVDAYYYPHTFGGGNGALSDADAERLVAALEKPAKRPAIVPLLRGAAAVVGGKRYRTLRAAVRDAPDGAEIFVQPGVHRDPLVLDRPLALVGVGTLGTVVIESKRMPALTLASDGIMLSRLVVRRAGEATRENRCALDVDSGRALVEDCEIVGGPTDGIWIRVGADPTFRRCAVRECGGGGVWIGRGAAARFEDCTFHESHDAGVEVLGNARFVGCTIANGASHGVLADEGGTVLERCTIRDNAGIGVWARASAGPILRDCSIHASGRSGIHVGDGANVTLERCDLAKNTHSGLDVADGRAIVRGSRVRENAYYGILVHDGGRALVDECSVVDNADSGIGVRAGCEIELTRSHVSGNAQYGLLVTAGARHVVERSTITGNVIGDVGADKPRRG